MTSPDWTLVVLAAGVGRRFGGEKQLDPIGPQGELLSDYALGEARAAGAARAVFVIRSGLEAAFRAHHARWSGYLDIGYVHQPLDDLPPGRTAPWGTAHALLAARAAVPSGCVVVNADDCYGPDAISAAAGALPDHAVVGYPIGDTLSPHGGVSRALLQTGADGWLSRIDELREVRAGEAGLTGRRGDAVVTPARDALVSMNCWAFGPGVWPLLAAAVAGFLGGAPAAAECALPDVVSQLVGDGRLRVRVLPAGRGWLGVTHRADREAVAAALAARPSPLPSREPAPPAD